MFFLYSALYFLALIILSPYFLLNREKYLSGFGQRLGFLPDFSTNGKPVVWVHCVSVGETNAVRPLIKSIKNTYPGYLVVVSTTTKTAYELASRIFLNEASLVFYMPFDLPFVVKKVLRKIKPDILLIVETEIWLNIIRLANSGGASVIFVNGRLSKRSSNRYALIPKTLKRALRHVELALMQTNEDAKRIVSLGLKSNKVKVTGNFKFDQEIEVGEVPLTAYFKERFGFGGSTPLIVAASTHAPEERWVIEAFCKTRDLADRGQPRLVIAPRHPERFEEVADLIADAGLSIVRRSDALGIEDDQADVMLLDSIGELRAVYPLADLVFVGGTLIPHGGQSILEPALAGKAIVTGNSMTNFAAIATEFANQNAFVQLPKLGGDEVAERLASQFLELLNNPELKESLAKNAHSVMVRNRGATVRTLNYLKPYLQVTGNVLRG